MEIDWDDPELDEDMRVGLAGFFETKPAYFVHDGSLERGFEVVFHPLEAQQILNMDCVPHFLKFVSRTGCAGTHIHISRGAFRDKEAFLKFLRTTKLVITHPRYLRKLMLRDLDQRNVRTGRYYFRPIEWDLEEVADKWEVPDRYHWVNITDNTVECRFFEEVRTNKQLRTYIKLLEILIEYANSDQTRQELTEAID
ncbi:MAG: hypothetical protein D6706_14910, partial [Chloroflexi bacterium]